MKKFITVLLALSMVFTYSFSAVWATTPTEPTAGNYIITEAQAQGKIDAAYTSALAAVAAEEKTAIDNILGGPTASSKTISGVEITRTALQTAFADRYAAAVKAVNDSKGNAYAGMTAAAKAATDYAGKFYLPTALTEGTATTASVWSNAGYAAFDANWADSTTYFGSEFKVAAYEAAFAGNTANVAIAAAEATFNEVKAAQLKAISAVDVSGYSTTTYTTSSTLSDFDAAAAAKAQAITLTNNVTLSYPVTNADVANKISQLYAIYKAPINSGSATGSFPTELSKLTLTSTLPTEAAKLAWAKSTVLNDMLGTLNSMAANEKLIINNEIVEENLKASPSASKIAQYKSELAEIDTYVANATEIITYTVNNTTKYSDLIKASTTYPNVFTKSVTDTDKWNILGGTFKIYNGKSTVTYSFDLAKAVVGYVADLKEQAALYKKAQGIEGSTAVDVDDALADAIDYTYYQGAKGYLEFTTTVNNVYRRAHALIGDDGDTVKVGDKTYPCVEAWDDALDSKNSKYDSKYYDQIRKIMADAETAIKAATTVDAANKAFTDAYAKLAAIPTVTTKLANQATSDFQTQLTAAKKDLEAYMHYKLDNNSEFNYINESDYYDSLVEGLMGAYTVDELKAALADAKTTIDNTKTQTVIAKEQSDLQARINALPTSATLADEATVLALMKDVEAHDDYCDMVGSTTYKVQLPLKLHTAEQDVLAAAKKVLQDQYDAIYKDGKVTIDEADAVAKLAKDVDAAAALLIPENATNNEIESVRNLIGINVMGMQEDLLEAQVKNVAELIAVASANGSDVNAVNAAIKAYNALSTDGKMMLYEGNDQYAGMYDKLIDLEKLQIKNVESLKITAASKASKGKMTVTWKVNGIATGVTYQVMRSTQKNAGFKYMKTTSSLKYVNTKNLKAGKVYYYKVRAYITIDGVKYYSDWSNKAFRTAK